MQQHQHQQQRQRRRLRKTFMKDLEVSLYKDVFETGQKYEINDSGWKIERELFFEFILIFITNS